MNSEGKGGPELPAEIRDRFATYLGEGKAAEVENDVRSGEMSVAKADSWSLDIQALHERSRNRPDIEPEQWQAFEEGWRPEGWTG